VRASSRLHACQGLLTSAPTEPARTTPIP
jgi:hypothetical protein